ncbi:MAG: hypothetical protein G8237_11960 [Magnetococcales bacterium]|nr:hypothetical protein [Magnetococcales bacterium]NGZ07059.1 hypothetical protein [Magnetococcales bacterium]
MTTHPWLLRFQNSPDQALNRLLSGTAYLPGLERAAASDALANLFGHADPEARARLDQALTGWLQQRRAMGPEQRRRYGLHRFIAEYSEGLATTWRLELPESSDWLANNLIDLYHWAAPLCIPPVWNLPRHLLLAGVQVIRDQQAWRFFWWRLCQEAVDPQQEFLLDAALNGLAHQPDSVNDKTRMQLLLQGLARWAVELSDTSHEKERFLWQWRVIKARFPHPPQTWRERWSELLARYQKEEKTKQEPPPPYYQWLIESEPGLGNRLKQSTPPSRKVPLNIPEIIEDLQKKAKKEISKALLQEMQGLLVILEDYADQTGDEDFLVRSACNLGATIVQQAPGKALEWARKALSWRPNLPYAWDLRGRALYQLHRPDLAEWVYWEGMRRLPEDATVRVQLSRLLRKQGRLDEALLLLQEGVKRHPDNHHAKIELAHLWLHCDNRDAAIALLRSNQEGLDQVGLYVLACLWIAEGNGSEAKGIVAVYRRRFGENQNENRLTRWIDAGPNGQREAINHFEKTNKNFYFEERGHDHAAWMEQERALQQEGGLTGVLQSIGAVARADLWFRRNDGASQEQADQWIRAQIDADENDLFAWVVGALHRSSWRQRLQEQAREFPRALAVQLAVADSGTTSEEWQMLAERFPRERELIDLVRLFRVKNEDAAIHDRLCQWVKHPQAREDPYWQFLKEKSRPHLMGLPEAEHIPLPLILAEAIKRCVPVPEMILSTA